MLTAQTFRFLAGPQGRATLSWLAARDLGDAQTLPLLDALRRDLPPDLAAAALTLARLRARATAKFSRAEAMFFTPDALEQASGEIVSAWRARRFALGGYPHIADLGCGVGGDALALAALPGVRITGLDRDPLRLALARANLAAYGRAADWARADLNDPLPLHGVRAAFFDPARRADGRRLFSVRDYAPPLDVIAGWRFAALAVKLAPGVALDELAPYTHAGAGVEFVSAGGELKEAVLWDGELGFAGRCASRADAGETLWPQGAPPPPLSAPRAYLVEPDPAIIRAGLLSELAAHLGLTLYRLDESIAYLTGDDPPPAGWARAWRVLAWLPFQLKRVRAALRERGIGRVTVKKRGSPLSPEEAIRLLKLDGGGEEAVVVLTQVAGRHCALICAPPSDH
ncbi:MAG: class I SAM-dependent methyltransferase [Anaerolineae bacterium]|nr:class I SAM-dependent methyltransferase [Anaerolineae bacterium]